MSEYAEYGKVYKYQGQRIRSELPLLALRTESLTVEGTDPSLVHSSALEHVDLHLKLGGNSGIELTPNSDGWLLGKGTFGFNLPGIGIFIVQEGRQVYVQPESEDVAVLVEQILLGTAFAVAMMQRGLFCLHGAVLSRNGRTIAFCGDSGEGKSTLAVALSKEGWQVLTDDLALVRPCAGGFEVKNNGRHVRLWAESLAAMGYGTEGLTRISSAEDKYYIRAPLESNVEGARLDAICFLESGTANDPFSLESVHGMPALSLLRRHTYRQELLSLLDCDSSHLKHSCALLAAVPLWRFKRPRSLSRLNELVDFVTEEPALGGCRG